MAAMSGGAMSVKNFIDKIRRRETRFYDFLYRILRFVLAFHLPTNRFFLTLGRLLFYLHVFVRESSRRVLTILYYEPMFRGRCERVGDVISMEALPYIAGQGRLVVGDHVTISYMPTFAFNTQIYPDPILEIGDHTFIASGVEISVAQSVRIGNFCLIARGVQIRDSDGHPTDYRERRKGTPVTKEGISPVTIHDDVWIGAHSIILKGVTIGPRSIIGSGAIVTHDVPPDCVAVGNPARIVRKLETT